MNYLSFSFMTENHSSQRSDGRTNAASSKITCRVELAMFDRWIITRGDDSTLAWSGARWIPHRNGVPLTNVPVPNFGSEVEANRHALRCGFRILTD
jgi:hypothetical protein